MAIASTEVPSSWQPDSPALMRERRRGHERLRVTPMAAAQPSVASVEHEGRVVTFAPVGGCRVTRGPLRCTREADHEFGCVFHSTSGGMDAHSASSGE